MKPADGTAADALLALAAAAEATAEHPLAQAVVKAAFARRLALPEVAAFEAVPGKGVRARLDAADESALLDGSSRFLGESGVDLSASVERITALEEAGRTVIVVARDGRALGLLGLGDAVRAEAAGAGGCGGGGSLHETVPSAISAWIRSWR